MFTKNSISAALAATLLTAVVGATDPAVAAEYSWQIAGSGSRLDSAGGESDSYSVDATYYVNRVDDGSGPYALASFFDPATRLSVTASRSDATSPIGVADDPTAYGFNGRYVWNASGWYAGGGYSKADLDDDPASSARVTDPEGYSALVGKYLGPRTTLELGMGWSESRTELQLACLPPAAPCPATLTTDVDSRSTSLSAVHVRQFRSLTYALRGGITETDVDLTSTLTPGSGVFNGVIGGALPDVSSDARNYSVGAEFFPRRNLGIGVGYSRPEDFDSHTYSLDATWFFKPRVAVQVSVGRGSVPGAVKDPESFGLRLIGRL